MLTNALTSLCVLLGFASVLSKITMMISYVNKHKSFCNFLTIITVMFIFDVDLPYVFYLLTGKIKTLYYYPDFSTYLYFCSFFFLNTAFALFLLGFVFFVSKKTPKKLSFSFDDSSIKKIKRVVPVLVVFFLVGVLIDINAAGSFDFYYRYHLLRSVEVKLSYSNSLLSYYSEIASFMINPIILLCIIIIQNSRKFIDKLLSIIVIIILMLTTFSRGYILKVACIYLIVYEGSGVSFSKVKKRVLVFGIIAAIVFIGFTGIRSLMIGDLFNDVDEYSNFVFYSIEKLFVGTLGSSLVGMTRVIHYVFYEGSIMNGQSIFELSYRFIPRAIWEAKPLNYGVQTINALLGSPSSTMDAVSLAGEMIINFHLLGLLLMPVYGILVAKSELNRGGEYFKYCYAINIFGLATTTMWMGNTGMLSHLFNVLYTYIVVRVFLHFGRNAKHSHSKALIKQRV